ncbi:MAG TPA: transposase family protein [Candidatus Enterocloster excrementigallinarum]|uniref:Transposase family protein n=1 Tax=Candidatus Enterocloster excrementigallinarum TaxID=2838558 RepID=A0A9D2PSV6_9FIRM|nr:transposase family protein [Candidatus Enterocloster excrementigallinarum]
MIHYFRLIPDDRCGRERRHDLVEMLVCVTLGFLCGRTTIRRSLKWCKAHPEELWQHMELKYGIASPSSIMRN